MSEPPHKPAHRRPSLSDALKAAKKVVEDGRVMLTFVGDDAPVEVGTNEWDEALKHRGKL